MSAPTTTDTPPCPRCGARRQAYKGKVAWGWAIIHKPGCTALAPVAPRPKPKAVP